MPGLRVRSICPDFFGVVRPDRGADAVPFAPDVGHGGGADLLGEPVPGAEDGGVADVRAVVGRRVVDDLVVGDHRVAGLAGDLHRLARQVQLVHDAAFAQHLGAGLLEEVLDGAVRARVDGEVATERLAHVRQQHGHQRAESTGEFPLGDAVDPGADAIEVPADAAGGLRAVPGEPQRDLPAGQYKITRVIDNPSKFPPSGEIERVEEPFVDMTLITPEAYLGGILELLEQRRGEHREMQFAGEGRVTLKYFVPLAEIALDFYDQLKARSQGYASLDYEHAGYHPSDLVKLDVLVHHQPVDALCCIVHRDLAFRAGKRLVARLKDEIPRAQFPIALQAALGRRVIARETIPAFRKDVTQKLYGGDVTRKMKLLEKQKVGKRRMKSVGQVEIPQSAFLSVLERD